MFRRLLMIPVAVALVAALMPVSAQALTPPQDNWSPGFYDTRNIDWQRAPGAWARVNGIVTGVDKPPASPVPNAVFPPVPHMNSQATTTRAMAITMLWRAAGSPPACAPTVICSSEVQSPTDVPATAYYAKAVEWGVRNGVLTRGQLFAPNRDVTRAEFVTMVWRADLLNGPGDGTILIVFDVRDVPKNAYYARAVQWGMRTGVVSYSPTFRPTSAITRAAAVAMLYRQYAPESVLPGSGRFTASTVTGRTLVDGTSLSMAFSTDGRVQNITLYGGCNVARGTVSPLTADRVSMSPLASTYVECFPPDISGQEIWFFNWLNRAPVVTPSGNGFTMTGDGVSITFVPDVVAALLD